MRNRLGFLPFAILAFFLPAGAVAQPHADTLPLKVIHGTRIIVEGRINDSTHVNAMIDTGANCSVISSKIARRLQLRTLLKALPFVSLDRVIHRPLVIVPSVVLGPIHRTIACLADDIPLSGVDMIIARDIIRDHTITVDYEHRSLRFGPGETLKYHISFDRSLLVELQLGTRKIPVMLDSGSDQLVLFWDRVVSWLPPQIVEFLVQVPGVSTLRRGARVRLANVRFGSAELRSVKACVLEAVPRPLDLEWHGLFGLAQLNAKRVRFDFPNGVFSWEP